MSRKAGLFLSPYVFLFFFVSSSAVFSQSLGRPQTMITESVNESKLVTLRGNTHPQATASNDRGPVADSMPMQHLWLQLKRSPEQQATLDQYTEELSDPNSPNFHRWLTAAQFGEQFGVAQSDLDAVSSWLRAMGLNVESVAPNRMLITFSGSAGQVGRAFHVRMDKLNVDGSAHVANMNDPQIPAALAPVVAGIVKLNDFAPRAMHTKIQPRSLSHPNAGPSADTTDRAAISPDFTYSPQYHYVSPQDLATIYNLNPLFESGHTGRGQTIVVLEDSDVYSAADWTQFRKNYGLTRPYIYGNFTQTHPSSAAAPCDDPGDNGDDVEAIIDAQWASAAAPDANIVLASCANTYNFGPLIALYNYLNASTPPPAIISISYGASEAEQGDTGNLLINALFQQAAAEGVSLFVSTGDSGGDNNTTDRKNNVAVTGISVNGLGSTAYNVAVGGTDFEDSYLGDTDTYWNTSNTPFFGSARSYLPEIPWNESCGSVLLANYLGYAKTYGPDGFCNSAIASGNGFLNVGAASGGPSAIYAKPSWQRVYGNPSDGVRDLPDVSLFAADAPWGHAYVLCYSAAGYSCVQGYFYDAGGTSFASPIMAGIQALVNQKVGDRVGNPNPTYYALARNEYGASGSSSCNSSLGNATSPRCTFHDVTAGDIDIYCQGSINCFTDGTKNGVLSVSSSKYEPAFTTDPGWDFATGIGTVNAYNLVMNWPAAPKSK